jgi:hypothetical protein
MCQHTPPCPGPDQVDHEGARTVAFHPEQGWSLLCNGVIVFDDTGALVPAPVSSAPLGARAVSPHRGPARHCQPGPDLADAHVLAG